MVLERILDIPRQVVFNLEPGTEIDVLSVRIQSFGLRGTTVGIFPLWDMRMQESAA